MDESSETLDAHERAILDALEADLTSQKRARPMQQHVIRPPRIDDGGGGFPPIDPIGPRYGRRPPRRAARRRGIDLSTWGTVVVTWGAIGASYAIDDPVQRVADRPLMLVVLTVGTVAATIGRGRR